MARDEPAFMAIEEADEKAPAQQVGLFGQAQGDNNDMQQNFGRGHYSKAVIAAAISRYPDYIKNVVVPLQGDDIVMIPDPETRYQLYERPLKETIYGHVFAAKRIADDAIVIVKRSYFDTYDRKHKHQLENPFKETSLAYAVPPHANIVNIIEVSYDDISHVCC